jgi:hypothetical protein
MTSQLQQPPAPMALEAERAVTPWPRQILHVLLVTALRGFRVRLSIHLERASEMSGFVLFFFTMVLHGFERWGMIVSSCTESVPSQNLAQTSPGNA